VSSCCGEERPALRRGVRLAGWVLPGLVLALVPKCPFCLIAWAAWAGIGVGLPAAGYLRAASLGLAAGALLLATVRALARRRSSRRRMTRAVQPVW
jgi:hypothetical protein